MNRFGLILGAAYLCAGTGASTVQLQPRSISSVTTFTATGSAPPCAATSFPVDNGGFEDGNLDSWSVSRALGAVSAEAVSPGSGSEFAAELSLPSSTDGISITLTHDTIYLCREAPYRLEFDYKVPETRKHCGVYFYTDIPTQPQPAGFTAFGHERPWTHAHFHFATAGSGAVSINVEFGCNKPGLATSLLIDNFTIVPAPGDLELPGCPRSMFIDNGAFEDGNLDNWGKLFPTANVNYSVVSPGHGPDSKYLFQADFNGKNQKDGSFSLYRKVFNFCVGYNYTFTWSYIFQNYDYANHPQFCSLIFNDPECIAAYNPDPASDFSPYNTWTRATYTCQSLSNADHSISFTVNCGDPGYPPTYNYTEFSFLFDNLVMELDPPQD